jgi:hypothetical protein
MKYIQLVGIACFSIFTAQLSAACNCECPPAAQGPIGAQGPAGPTGPIGSTGPQGVQGPEGPQSPCCPGGIAVNASLYSLLNQTIAPFGTTGDTITFEDANNVTTGFITTVVGTTGDIFFTQNGVYEIQYTVQGFVPPSDRPAWSVGLYLDGIYVPGSSFATHTDEDEIFGNSGGSVIISVASGQALRLRNNTSQTVFLTATTPGIVNPLTSASINIIQLKTP